MFYFELIIWCSIIEVPGTNPGMFVLVMVTVTGVTTEGKSPH